MTKEQIEKYRYCSGYMQQIDRWQKDIPFGGQNFGVGSGS